MTVELPSDRFQIEFLQNLQRLLSEGAFVASYKYALIQVLADLCVLKGKDSGDTLELRTDEIAEKFIELYWRQSINFSLIGIGESFVLRQNTGKQAGIIQLIRGIQESHSDSYWQFRNREVIAWEKLKREVERIVKVMPLWKLQTIGSESLEFLYDNVGSGNRIVLKKGVAFCFRAFYELVRDLVKAAWVAFVEKLNAQNLGGMVDLGSFLFGSERKSLEFCPELLLDYQKGACFYCDRRLNRDGIQVDHFIPWAKYPADIGSNFVLAHPICNNSKSDHLAGVKYLEKWAIRNENYDAELEERFQSFNFPFAFTAGKEIANWVYSQTERINGQVWVQGKGMVKLGAKWRALIA